MITSLRFSLGGFDADTTEIEYRGGELIKRHGTPFNFQEVRLPDPGPEKWARFWRAVDLGGVWDWAKEYTNDLVLDGIHWSLELGHDGKSISSEGSNSYPGTNEIEYPPESSFAQFVRALEDLTGVDLA